MKIITKLVSIFSMLVGLGSYSFATDPVWQVLGSGGFSVGKSARTCIVIDSNDVPYAAYMDNRPNINQANVKKYNGSSWEFVGNANFSAGIFDYLSIAISSSGTPYVAYMDYENTYEGTSMKYDSVGDIWVDVGVPGFTTPGEGAYGLSLTIDGSDTLYAVYSRKDYYGIWNYKAEAMKYTGTSWVYLQQRAISGENARDTTIVISRDNIRYVAYRDGSNSDKAVVKKKDTSYYWHNVGPVASTGAVKDISITLDSRDIPYVAYKDIANGGKATVMKYHHNSNTWVPIGQAGFSAGTAEYVSLAIDGSDTPYVAYSSSTTTGNITVMKFDGSNWVVVGNATIASGRMYRTTSLATDSKGTPYVLFQAADTKATVMYAPSITCKRKDQDGNCIPGVEDPGWTGPYPEVPFDGNYGQGDATEEGNRTADPGWTDPYPEIPCGGTPLEQGSDECAP